VPPATRVRALQRAKRAAWQRPFGVDRNICNFLWYSEGADEGLRSDGVDDLPLSKSVCSILPLARHLRAEVLRGSGLYNVSIVGRVVPAHQPATRPSLLALASLALRVASGGETVPTGGGHGKLPPPCSAHRLLS
jgi:hypothetical protein